jgi:hypothetical protein
MSITAVVEKGIIKLPKGTPWPPGTVVRIEPVEEQAPEYLSPREALRQLQAEARLTPEQARDYLEDLRTERLAAETRRSA